MRDLLALLSILLGAAFLVGVVARVLTGRRGAAAGTRSRAGVLMTVLAVAGAALLVLGLGVVRAPDTTPVTARSAPRLAVWRARAPTPTSTPTATPWDASPAGAYRRFVDASCAGVGVVLLTPTDASRTSIGTALRTSAASFEDLADVLDAVQPPTRLLNRHHRLVTAVRRTAGILTGAAAQLRAGATAGYARQLDRLGSSVTDLDRQARSLQLPHCRPS